MTDSAPDLTAGVALDDIPADGMLAGTVGEHDVLLARWTDDAGRPQVSALDAACTHRGADLSTGLRTGHQVVCPFHHACFDLRTGEATWAPAIEPLGRWRVTVADGRVTVSGPSEPGPAERVDNDRGVTRVVVVGGGAAGFACVERLRRAGYAGGVALVSGEAALPIDRTELSKNYLSGAKTATDLPLQPPTWYADHDVEAHLGVLATSLDLAERVVTLSDGRELVYDALVLATGAEPVRPDLPGFDRDDALVLRTAEDADAIVAAAAVEDGRAADGPGRRVVVVGNGFIGMEAAAALRQREVDVTVVAPDAVPMLTQLGADLGAVVKALHEEHGTRLVVGTAAGWTGSELLLEDGDPVPADVVVLGLGVRPRTDLAQAAGLQVDDGVLVDAGFETPVAGVFAVGDIARFPHPETGEPIRVEHWAQAERSGALAAVNLLGGQQTLTEPPFYWSQQFGKSFRLAGHADSLADARVDDGGDGEGQALLVTFAEGGRTVAAAGVGRDHDLLVVEDEQLRS